MAPPVVKKSVKKEETPLTAVLIADIFDQRFTPVLRQNESISLLPICNVPVVDFALSWLLRTEIEDILLVSSQRTAESLKDVEKNWKPFFQTFSVIGCEGARSVGDCLREIHNRELLKGDFLLISNPATVTSSTLVREISNFRKRRAENVDNMMTLVYAASENRDKSVVGIQRETGKLLLYHAANNVRQLEVDKDHFYNDVDIRRDLLDCGLAFCTRLVATQFSDNFDFQQRDDVVREILSKEDILGLNIHVDVLNSNEAALSATDYDSFLTLSIMLVERWFYPITPDKAISTNRRTFFPHVPIMFTSKRLRRRLDVYHRKLFPTAQNSTNSTIGETTSIGDNTLISRCIIGVGCKIGADCVIEDAVIGDNVVIPDGVVLKYEVLIGNDVKIPESEERPPLTAVCSTAVDEDEFEKIVSRPSPKFDVHYWSLRNGKSFWRNGARLKSSEGSDNDDECNDSDLEESDAFSTGINDSTKQFYEEVLESMERILSMETQLMQNLILEINSSRLACNVSMDDAARNVFAAFLVLPGNDQLAQLLKLVLKWKPLFLNYYKSTEEQLAAKAPSQRKIEIELKRKCQIQMLLAVEDKYDRERAEFGPKVPKLVHFLYNDADVLDEEAILEWANTIAADSPLKNLMQPIVDWLQAEDDDDDDDE
ncbi:unnamed protein product [Caenorhabditis auriculariae]|uniref:Translation initiation factor eIF2B subunit epsilon n=1 Tax=Caenorhabditis auriculariae TaxID=2777116 RepID=A0A8S1H7D4_9PELO|nr:unnamed protein product [Caenorhabditis auriculariae]